MSTARVRRGEWTELADGHRAVQDQVAGMGRREADDDVLEPGA